jgi:hypothetical protein
VMREGIAVDTVHAWPDRIGERINPLAEAA